MPSKITIELPASAAARLLRDPEGFAAYMSANGFPDVTFSGARYHGECECPQCGLGSAGLKAGCLPFAIKRFGTTVLLVCDICGKQWMQEEKP
jgi:hypothetical protein